MYPRHASVISVAILSTLARRIGERFSAVAPIVGFATDLPPSRSTSATTGARCCVLRPPPRCLRLGSPGFRAPREGPAALRGLPPTQLSSASTTPPSAIRPEALCSWRGVCDGPNAARKLRGAEEIGCAITHQKICRRYCKASCPEPASDPIVLCSAVAGPAAPTREADRTHSPVPSAGACDSPLQRGPASTPRCMYIWLAMWRHSNGSGCKETPCLAVRPPGLRWQSSRSQWALPD